MKVKQLEDLLVEYRKYKRVTDHTEVEIKTKDGRLRAEGVGVTETPSGSVLILIYEEGWTLHDKPAPV